MPRPTPQREHGPSEAVEVFAPARLHLGFLDLNGDLGRRFGSIGLTLDGLGTRLTLTRAKAPRIVPPSAVRAAQLLASLSRRYALEPLDLTLHETIPEHVGLGSGTQLSLAIGAAMAALAGESLSSRALASLLERGARSGIGIGAFAAGGFLVDGGKGEADAPAPIIARMDFPAAWRVILISDDRHRGLSGAAEIAAFRDLTGLPADVSAQLCRLTLLRLLPGLAEADFAAFAESIGEIGARLGDHFAPVQGGRFASPRVAGVLGFLSAAGHRGIGQSSWGPTGFVFAPGAQQARALRDELARRFSDDDALSFRICAGRNGGAEITPLSRTAGEKRVAEIFRRS
jgi:beta-ribofuranosylaminobenzene 5'-phosphate synthase